MRNVEAKEMVMGGLRGHRGLLCNKKKKAKKKVTNDIGSCLVCWKIVERRNKMKSWERESYDMEMEYNINFYTIFASPTQLPLIWFQLGIFFCWYIYFMLFVRVCYVMETDSSALKQCDKFHFLYFSPTPRITQQNNNETHQNTPKSV